MLKIAYISSGDPGPKPTVKKPTKKEVEYLDSLNWVNQQRALDVKEANKFLEESVKELETEKPRL